MNQKVPAYLLIATGWRFLILKIYFVKEHCFYNPGHLSEINRQNFIQLNNY